MLTKWDERWFNLAKEVANWSKDPRKKVGAVLVSPDNRQLSVGYNGLPAGMEAEDLGQSYTKNEASLHAEVNAILNNNKSAKDWTLYITAAPCLQCSLIIVQKEIKRIVCPKPVPMSSWYKSQTQAKQMLEPQVIITYTT